MINQICPTISSLVLVEQRKLCMELKHNIARLYPGIKRIIIKVTDTNAWSENRLREFVILPDVEYDFHLDCPMAKCLGNIRGIYYWNVITDMIDNHISERQVKLTCEGYNGYNLTSHCDWYAVLEISIEYLGTRTA